MNSNATHIFASIRRHVSIGLAAVGVLVIGVGGLAAMTYLSGAVIGSGFLVVDTNVKKIQHPAGGVIKDVLVRNGDPVQAGALLIRLDETIAQANSEVITKNLNELSVREVRLEAERDGHDEMTFAPGLSASRDTALTRLKEGEIRLFDFRRKAREGQKSQLSERILQLEQEINGLTAQAGAKAQEIELVKVELESIRTLWEKGLVPIARKTSVERDAKRLEGEHGALVSSIAQAKGRIAETRLQIIQLDQNLRSEVAKELNEIQAKKAELTERKAAADYQLKNIEIRAPQAGVVHQLQAYTVGGVIAAAETLMLIVPTSDTLIVEVKINPQDIDQIKVGQAAVVRFPAFTLGTTPEINGSVTFVSPDLISDPRTQAVFFNARIAVPESEMSRIRNLKPVAGMPVEAFIQTGSRTILSYLMKPLSDQVMRAGRER